MTSKSKNKLPKAKVVIEPKPLPVKTIAVMKAMALNSWFVTDCYMITRVPGGWLYARNWDNGNGAHSIFVSEVCL